MTKSDMAGVAPTIGATSSSSPCPPHRAAATLDAANGDSDPRGSQPRDTTAMELALEDLDKVIWASMGRRPHVVSGVAQAKEAADAIRGSNGTE